MPESTAEPRATRVYRRLLSYAVRYKLVFAIAVLAMIMQALSTAGFAALVKPLIDGTFVDRDPLIIRWMPVTVFGLFALRGVGWFASTYSIEWIGRHVVTRLRGELFDKFLVLPTTYVDHSSAGGLLSKLTYNTEQVSESSTRAVTILIRDSLSLVGLTIWMIYLSPSLSLTVVLIAPPVWLLARYASKLFRRYSHRIQDSMGDVTRVAEQAIQGQRVVKIFDGTRYESDQFGAVNERNRRAFMKQVLVKAISVPIVQLIAAVGLAGIIYFATRPQAGMTAGQFSSFIAAMLLVMDHLKRLTNVNAVLQKGIAAARSIFDVLDEPPEIDRGSAAIERAGGRIEFRGVSFAYAPPDIAASERDALPAHNPVLRDIDLTIDAGETVALVGSSGSGKSTLVSLMPRFYDPQHGSILLDGTDIRDLSLADLRRQIALVTQDITLFSDSILNNIAYGGLRTATPAQIEAAARSAYVLDFAASLPNGLDTVVGDRGVLLSGGQRQRVAIARALLKDAPVLILDEATSSLDTESERHIQTALVDLMKNRTTLVIAHRLSTVERADRIVVLENGRIAESGTHGELLAKSGRYATLHGMQFSDG